MFLVFEYKASLVFGFLQIRLFSLDCNKNRCRIRRVYESDMHKENGFYLLDRFPLNIMECSHPIKIQ